MKGPEPTRFLTSNSGDMHYCPDLCWIQPGKWPGSRHSQHGPWRDYKAVKFRNSDPVDDVIPIPEVPFFRLSIFEQILELRPLRLRINRLRRQISSAFS